MEALPCLEKANLAGERQFAAPSRQFALHKSWPANVRSALI
jgi:hypothetical protein